MKQLFIYGVILTLLGSLMPLNAQDSHLDTSQVNGVLLPTDSLGRDTTNLSKIIFENTGSKLVQPLLISSAQHHQNRWVSISFGSHRKLIQTPMIETDALKGKFSIHLSGVDTSAYLGDRVIRDHGKLPIQFQVDFPDSNSVRVTGQVLAFDNINNYYSFSENEYRLEFIYQDQSEKLFQESTQEGVPADTVLTLLDGGGEQQLNHNLIEQESREFKNMLINSVYIGGGALALTLIIFVLITLIQRNRKKRNLKETDFSELLDQKIYPSNTVDIGDEATPLIMTPEMKEEKIRGLMEDEKLSYDEAALRVQYETMNQDDG